MSAGEQGHEARSFSPSDDGANDDQADDATRDLNNAQLGRRSRYHEDKLRSSNDDSEADENDDIGPIAPRQGDAAAKELVRITKAGRIDVRNFALGAA